MFWLTSSLRNKLYAITGISAVLVLAATFYGFAALWSSIEHYRTLVDQDFPQQSDVYRLQVMLGREANAWKNAMLRGREPKAIEKYWRELEQVEATILMVARQRIEFFERQGESSHAKALGSFAKSVERLGQSYRQGLATFKASGFSAAAAEAIVNGADKEPDKLLEQLVAVHTDEITTEAKKAGISARRAIGVALSGVAITVVLALAGFSVVIRRSILAPTRVLVSGMDRFAAGDFTRSVVVDTHDELGQLAKRMDEARVKLGGVIRDASATADQLAHSADSLSQSSRDSSSNVQHQQSEMDQLATAINEMAATVQEVARNTDMAAGSARDADTQASEGKAVVTVARQSIEALAKEVESAAQVIARLVQDSVTIGSVLDVIRQVAEQTNLLALNAAIEAARAGEQGRGFAVVADEVRTLASRTQQSTEEIRNIIEKLQAAANEAMKVMQAGQAQARQSVTETARVDQTLGAIAASVSRIRDMSIQIASATEEQSKVAEEVSRNVTNLNTQVGQSSDAVEQMARQSTELSGFADTLKSGMRQFRV